MKNRFRAFLKKFNRNAKLLEKISIKKYLLYHLGKKGKEMTVTISRQRLVLRKRTPDLRVAISCLGSEFECLRYLLPQDFDGVIVDAGGYIGTSALALRRLFPRAKIIVIEPSEDNLRILRKNIGEDPGIEIVQGALIGHKEDSISLRNRGTGEWGYTVVSAPKDNAEAPEIQSTPAYMLNQLVSDPSTIGLLKLDIEGGEVDLLKHDLDTLRAIPAVFAELHDGIVEGCSELFFQFSKDRIVVCDGTEKFLSIRR